MSLNVCSVPCNAVCHLSRNTQGLLLIFSTGQVGREIKLLTVELGERNLQRNSFLWQKKLYCWRLKLLNLLRSYPSLISSHLMRYTFSHRIIPRRTLVLSFHLGLGLQSFSSLQISQKIIFRISLLYALKFNNITSIGIITITTITAKAVNMQHNNVTGKYYGFQLTKY